MKIFDVENGFIMCSEVLDGLKQLDDNTIDSVVTDPPYGISFMNKKWDYDVPKVEVWKEVLRVLKPGAHALIACGTRTQHRMVVNIEDVGFEVRDVITWHYGSGFPKSMDISKSLDKKAGIEREIVGIKKHPTSKDRTGNKSPFQNNNHLNGNVDITVATTFEAKQWEGWGTALKPATEFWTLVRKPLSEKTVAANILRWGVGGINIDGCRIETDEIITNHSRGDESAKSKGKYGDSNRQETHQTEGQQLGRFPANVIFDEFTAAQLDEQSGNLKSGKPQGIRNTEGGYNKKYGSIPVTGFGDQGGASRFFYCAKASGSERNKGLSDEQFQKDIGHNRFDKCKKCGGTILQNPNRPSACKCEEPERENNIIKGNHHPTVKHVKLMQYLVKLITPEKGLCLDLYNGSGTTGIACKLEGFGYIGIDREEEYCEISKARIDGW